MATNNCNYAWDKYIINDQNTLTYSKPKQRKSPMPSTPESLEKRPRTKTDRKWLALLFKGQDISKMPRTIFMKLMAKGLIDITLTKEGKPEGFIGAMKEL